jgi:hypothetical protein
VQQCAPIFPVLISGLSGFKLSVGWRDRKTQRNRWLLVYSLR